MRIGSYVGLRCDGQDISNAQKKEIEERCKEGIVVRTYEISPEKLPSQSRKKLVQQYNDKILEDLKKLYGFDEVKLAMQRCYPARDRKEMGQGDRAINQKTLEQEITKNKNDKESVRSNIESALKAEKKDRLGDSSLSSMLDMAMKDKKVQANYVKHGIDSPITRLSIITCFKAYEKNLQKHVDGMNKVLPYTTKVTAQDVLEAAKAVGGDDLVMKLLNNKRLDKSEKGQLFQKTKGLHGEQNLQKNQQLRQTHQKKVAALHSDSSKVSQGWMDRHLSNVQHQMGMPSQQELVSDKSLQEAIEALNQTDEYRDNPIILAEEELDDAVYIDIGDQIVKGKW